MLLLLQRTVLISGSPPCSDLAQGVVTALLVLPAGGVFQLLVPNAKAGPATERSRAWLEFSGARNIHAMEASAVTPMGISSSIYFPQQPPLASHAPRSSALLPLSSREKKGKEDGCASRHSHWC